MSVVAEYEVITAYASIFRYINAGKQLSQLLNIKVIIE